MSSNRPDFVTTGSTVSACEAIVNYLKPEIEGDGKQVDRVQAIERHIGRFDTPDDVRHWMTNKDGGVRVAALRVPKMANRGNRLVGTIEFVAYVFATDFWGFPKDTRAEVITARIAKQLSVKGWAKGLADSGVERLRADNLYSGSLDKLGVSIWSVTWSQDWPLDTELDLTTLDEFRRFHFRSPMKDGAAVLEGDINPDELYEQVERVDQCCKLGFDD